MDITEFKRLTSTNNVNRHPWELTRVRIAHFLLTRYNIPCNAIADVGSGDAFVLKYLQQLNPGSTFAAIDHAYTPEIIELLKKGTTGDRIHFFNALENAFAWSPFTCVLLMDVIEHIQHDSTFMKDLVKASGTNNEVRFLITVPAFQSLFSKHDELLLHYRRYNIKRLTSLCRENNLQIIASGYFFFSLVPARILQLFAEKLRLRKPKKAVDNWEGGPFISKIISFILWIDFRICFSLNKLNIRLPGLSCYCLCQRSAS
ncbi:hypothetical protein A3860_30375 [Niastella vici]|uniref:Methyltransferase type 11 domain-containing protein n=1 Tax=Niastella vici TaxID=1703345 RepID=A0A1V9FUG2_9BACT|nr:class I SAM-dependent methyltransferase [Niastella vici]OQP61993.1 hypothetical protein A3860_30375 [Niastella vici]